MDSSPGRDFARQGCRKGSATDVRGEAMLTHQFGGHWGFKRALNRAEQPDFKPNVRKTTRVLSPGGH